MSTTTRPTGPGVSEVVSAVVCGALALAALLTLPVLAVAEHGESIVVVPIADPAWWVVVALILVQTIALLWGKRSPRRVLIAVAVIPALHALLAPGATFSLVTLAVAFAVFWAVVREPLRRLRVALPGVVVLVAVSQTANDLRSGAALDIVTVGSAVLQAMSIVGLPLVMGMFFAARRHARVSRSNELLALERERDALIQAAVSRERIAMSRELHDIAAHHMSGIALLASAMYRQVDLDPEAAKVSAQQVRTQSTTVLEDLRRVIGLLRDGSESSRSVETLAAVSQLVELRRGTGIEVEFVRLTAAGELGAGIGPLGQLVAYRMVQESLANAAAHAPGARCVVEIDDRQPEVLTVVVRNDRSHAPDPGPGGGFGLVGMRERAELVDADLHYGATGDGGWEVRLTLKRDSTIDTTEESA